MYGRREFSPGSGKLRAEPPASLVRKSSASPRLRETAPHPPPTPGQTEPAAAENPAAPRDSCKYRLHIVPGAGKGKEDQH